MIDLGGGEGGRPPLGFRSLLTTIARSENEGIVILCGRCTSRNEILGQIPLIARTANLHSAVPHGISLPFSLQLTVLSMLLHIHMDSMPNYFTTCCACGHGVKVSKYHCISTFIVFFSHRIKFFGHSSQPLVYTLQSNV